MMLHRLFLAFLVALPAATAGQVAYFQQETHYTIRAALNDRDHTLDAHIRIEYVNHAPQALSEIWMHLWPNAYQDRNTAFARQQLRDGSTRFYFAPDSSLGSLRNLDFRVDGQPVAWRYDARHPDIAVLTLSQPLPPGGRIAIETPFLLKIPASFSRLGHVGTSYQITQWYPKPAVFDTRGWHAMPYLDTGEFYSEFGSFDVEITLPDNYVVGATGALQTASERDFLQKKETETRAEMARRDQLLATAEKAKVRQAPFPPSSENLKTLRFTADSVHDFAWFADKRFFVLRDTARLASGRTVDCWAMFTAEQFDLWRKGAFYVRRAVEFYSQNLGEYPWPQATAVHSALSAGGGMEYPMITVIGDSDNAKSLDEVIAHEVGHNWFYGILASNERDHPWLDEGLNSYYEARYMQQHYGSDLLDNYLPRWVFDPAASGSVRENAYLLLAREGNDTPPDSPSDAFGPMAYGIQTYMKPAHCLEWLERSVGRQRFDQAMQHYYATWKFRHPDPDDLRAAWLEAGLEADWFFETMQTRRRFDLALTRVRRNADGGFDLTVKKRGALDAPFSLSALRDGRAVQTQRYPALGQRTSTVAFPAVEADAFVLDHERSTLDVHRRNNYRRATGLLPGLEPLAVRALALAERSNRTDVGVLPWAAWNNYDKTTVGLLLYNAPFPPRRFQYFLLPGYGIGSGQFAGMADVRYQLLPGGWLPRLTVGANARTATYAYNYRDEYYLRYYRFVPSVRLSLRSASPAFEHAAVLRTIFIGKEEAAYQSATDYVVGWQRATMHEARYEARQHRLPNPYQFAVALEQQRYRDPFENPAHYLRGSAEWQQQFFFAPKRKVSMRVFTGYFLANTQRQRGSVATNSLLNDVARASFALNPQGFNDYRFDQVFVGRTDDVGFFSRQVGQTEGGFKHALGAQYANRTGNSNNFIAALNLRADLPQRLPLGLPLKPYFDIGYFDDATPLGRNRPLEEQILWSGGFLLEFLNGTLEVYFPIVHAKPLRDLYTEALGNNYFRRISWSIRLGRVSTMDAARRVSG